VRTGRWDVCEDIVLKTTGLEAVYCIPFSSWGQSTRAEVKKCRWPISRGFVSYVSADPFGPRWLPSSPLTGRAVYIASQLLIPTMGALLSIPLVVPSVTSIGGWVLSCCGAAAVPHP